MRAATLFLAALFVLSGCATQEPVKVVDAGCEGAACQGQRAESPQHFLPAPDACDSARQAAEDSRREKGACERQLQTATQAQAEAEQALAGKSAELAALQQEAKADEDFHQQKAAAAEQELQTMRDARAEIEQGLAERGDELSRCLDDMVAIHEQTKTDEGLCLQKITAAEQELQAAQAARADAEQALAEQSAELASSRSDLAALQQQADADADLFRQNEEEAAQQLQALQGAQREAEEGLAEKDAELGRCRDEQAAFQEKADADTLAYEGMRQVAQKHAKDAETTARQLQRMKELEERLRQRLQSDIEARDVEIKRLPSQLSVRVLDRILFLSGSADILPRGRTVLDSVATALVDGDETIRVEGHTDTVPIGPNLKKKYYSNWELSTARASSVVRFFQASHAIEPTRMEAVGLSKYRPIAPNDTEANRQRNRRVEIKLTPWSPATEEGEP